MKVKCIDNCEGDYDLLTIGEEYEAKGEYNMNYGSRNGLELYERRLVVINDCGREYPYPFRCFDYEEGSLGELW